MPDEMAVFFLESCCWNVQNAISSFYESGAASGEQAAAMAPQGPEVPAPQLAFSDLGGPDHGNIVLPPRTPFQKSILVSNPGAVAWPDGCYIAATGGAAIPGDTAVRVPALEPGCNATVTLSLFAPDQPGTHAQSWRFFHSQGKLSQSSFGEEVWVVVTVDPDLLAQDDGTSGLLSSLSMTALASGVGANGGDQPMSSD